VSRKRSFELVGSGAGLEPVLERLRSAASKRGTIGELIDLGAGTRGYLKASPLRGRARWRHALRERVFARPAPRVNEFHNLAWLRLHDFHAPRPLVAGVLRGLSTVKYQFLLTEEVPDAPTLERFLERADPSERLATIRALANDVARLHDEHFVHRDLFPRNLLVPEPGRICFLDAWRGGPGPQLRGPVYDHACLMLDAPAHLRVEEQRAYFDTYLAARRVRNRRAYLERVGRERERLRARLVRRTGGAGAPPDAGTWDARVLG
jgi:hypothetical protein